MIQLTRINHKRLVLNSDLIEHLEVTPDTVISMTTGQKFMVLETAEEVIQRVIAFRKSICEALVPCPLSYTGAARISPGPPEEDDGTPEG
jgi:flagellar protein FlbD